MYLSRKNIIACKKVRCGKVHYIVSHVGDESNRPTSRSQVGNNPRGHPDPGQLDPVEVKYRSIIYKGFQVEGCSRWRIRREVEACSEVVRDDCVGCAGLEKIQNGL